MSEPAKSDDDPFEAYVAKMFAAGDDQEKWTEIYQKLCPEASRYIQSKFGFNDEAEDVWHLALQAAYKCIRRRNARGSSANDITFPSRWFYTILKHEASKYAQKLCRLRRLQCQTVAALDDLDHPTSEPTRFDNFDKNALATALQELSKQDQNTGRRYREIIELHYFEGRSLVEIAKLWGMNNNSVRTCHDRAKKSLREIMRGGDDC